MASSDRETARFAQLDALLRAAQLDPYALKHACLHGAIPDKLRPELWRHLLGVVDPSKLSGSLEERESSKRARRTQYAQLVQELLEAAAKRPLDTAPGNRKAPQDIWLDDIDKDVRRTQGSYAFFSQESSQDSHIAGIQARRALFDRLDLMHPHRKEEVEERYSLSPSSPNKGKQREDASASTSDRHSECLIRLLYIFALLNPVHYVQGMSELVAPLYYVFSHSDQGSDAEADTFWAFSNLMSEFGDFYVQDSDGSMHEQEQGQSRRKNANNLSVDTLLPAGESRTGLGATLKRYARQLHWIDKDLAFDLHRQKEVQPTFYALRWITCLFALEFPIPDLIQVWDSVFALLAETNSSTAKAGPDSQARDFLLDICCAMVLSKRSELLSSSFSSCLQMLQGYSCDDVNLLLTLAFNIRERRITSSLTGLDFQNFSSVPNSPAIGYEEQDTVSPLPVSAAATASLQSAKTMFAAAAGSTTAQAFKNRFWRSPSTSMHGEVDFPDNVSDVSTATAPAQLEQSPSSPLRRLNRQSYQNTPSPSRTLPTSLPSSASSLLNRYASSLSQSDAAAALSKATTNSYIQAMQWKESAPSTLSQLRSDLSTKVSGAAGAAKTVIRPPSPHMDPPFTPPTATNGHFLSPEGVSASKIGERRASNGPKPLLLSSSARRASGAGVPAEISPSNSRRTSLANASPGPSVGLGLPSTYQTPDRPVSPSYRARSPSSNTAFRPSPHTKAASVTSFGSYKFGSGARNGHVSPPSVQEHSRAASLATPVSLHASLSGIDKPRMNERRAPSLDIPTSPLLPANDSSTRRKYKQVDSPFSITRNKGASSELEILDDGLTPTDDSATGPSTPSDVLSNYLQDYAYDPEVQEPAARDDRPATPPPVLDMRQTLERYSLSDDVPLSPTSMLARRKPRTSSLAPDTPQTPAKDVEQPLDRSRRRITSSRRPTQRDSYSASSVVSNDDLTN